MQRSLHRFAILLMLLAMALSPTRLYAANEEISAEERLAFEQRKAAAHMRELEARMYRLSEMLREAEPDHAARLMMGLERSREQLLVERMQEIRDLLQSANLDDAARAELEVLEKLEELRELLLSTDLDLQLKLDRLRKLTEAMARLDKIRAEEGRQIGEAGECAGGVPNAAQRMEQLRQDQQRNREATEMLKPQVRDLLPKEPQAAQKLGEAGKEMAQAEGQLRKGQAGQAQGNQEKALEKLDEVREQLDQERQRLLEEIQRVVRAQVEKALAQMLEGQIKIREATQTLGAKIAAGDDLAASGVQRMAGDEWDLERVAKATVTLVRETGFGVALPLALESIQEQMGLVAQDLEQGLANESVVAAEQRIEADIQALIDAMREEDKANQSPGQNGGQCTPEERERNKLTAELKILRILQARINRDTKEIDGRRPEPPTDLGPALAQRLRELRDRQQEVEQAVRALKTRVEESQ